MSLSSPTLDPTAGQNLARGQMVLHRVYDGGRRSVLHTRHILDEGEHMLGRLPEGARTIAVPDDLRTSRQHARLIVERNAVHVVDKSSHGTFVDGVRVQSASLGDGSVLRAGDTLFVLRHEPLHVDDAALLELGGDSVEVRVLRSTIAQVAPTDATVLFLGETGTGKEVAARGLHRLSGRAGRFVPVNCGAIPASLFESELFGHTKGAFTGADKEDLGLVRAAEGGTLFLDEIGELPLELQPKLLRFLDEGAVLGVGARKPVHVDVRVLAATHQDLPRAVGAGRFRGDLYARLAEIVVPLPPLRTRRDDVLELVRRTLRDDAPPLHPELAHALLLFGWPFNVREVVKVVSELQVKGRGKAELELALVSGRLENVGPSAHSPASPDPPASSGPALSEEERAEAPDKESLVQLLTEHKGVISEIARVTHRSRRQVRRWLERYELDADRYR